MEAFNMKNYLKTYEQYCCVLKRNIVLEETVFCNGTHTLHCTHFSECENSGGCKNILIEPRLNASAGAVTLRNCDAVID